MPDSIPHTHPQSLLSKAFNLPALQKSRWKWVDYLKGIAILLVVYRHILIGIQRSGIEVSESLVNANMIFYSFRMPLFFILSGIFISSSLAKRTTGQLISIKFENILYPYLIWSFIQVTLQIVLGNFTNSDRGLIDYTYILYQPRALDQFWYLPALFFTTILFILVKERFKAPTWLQLSLGIVFYFTAPFLDKISIISDWMGFYLFFALGDTISAFFFKKRSQAFFKSIWSLILLTPVFILIQVYYLNNKTGELEFLIISLAGCIYMFIWAFRLDHWNTLHFLRVIGYHSLQIYVMHVIVSALMRAVLVNMLGVHQPVILLIIGIIAGVTLPIIFYNLFIKDNIGSFLFFIPKRKKQLSSRVI